MRHYLTVMGVAWTEQPRLVRGLDYYTRTTFEFSHPLLGAQSAIGGGGRYDGLMAALGGPEVSGIGFGLGVDRTLLAREEEGLPALAPPLVSAFVVPLGPAADDPCVRLVDRLRAAGIATTSTFGGRGLKGSMKAADRSGARWAVIVGEDEVAHATAQVKDLTTGEQHTVPVDEIVEVIHPGAIDREGGH